MAHFSTKGRLISELSRSRTTSPHEEESATAGSFDMHNDQIINSTIQIPDNTNTTQQQLPTHYSNHHQYSDREPSEYGGSDGSADMSIELGRGVKRGARDVVDDVSDNIVFSLGDDNSQYEVTGTPPIRPRTSARKTTDTLRREASIRSAAKNRTASAPKQQTLSESIAKINAEEDEVSFVSEDHTHQSATATFHSRNSRFTRSRQTSATVPSRFTAPQTRKGTPQRSAANNSTVQSATHTANSYIIPDMPSITEMMAGARTDGTPIFSKTTSKPRSRFTSASYRPHQLEHAPVERVPVSDDEKAIYASLLLLKDKVAELENVKTEAQKRAEEYEGEIIDLRSQLQAERRRPDSALGSDDESRAQDKRRMEMTRLQASLQATQDRLERSERKIGVSDNAVKRITKERDELVTQIGVAYFNNEELKAENGKFQQQNADLRAENEDLKDEVDVLVEENRNLRAQLNELAPVEGENRDLKAQLASVREENRDLNAELAHAELQNNEATEQWQRKEQELNKRLQTENKQLKARLADAESQNGKATNQWQQALQKENQRLNAQLAHAESQNNEEQDMNQRMQKENQRLKARLAHAESQNDEATTHWEQKEEMNAKIQKENKHLKAQLAHAQSQNDEATIHWQQMEQELNARTQKENQRLKAQLAHAESQNDELTLHWQQKEQELIDRIQKKMETVREMQEATREMLALKAKSEKVDAVPIRSKKEGKTSRAEERAARRTSSTLVERQTEEDEDVLSKIAREVKKYRTDAAAAQARKRNNVDGDATRRSNSHSGQRYSQTEGERRSFVPASVHEESDVSEVESTTQLELPKQTRHTLKSAQNSAPAKNSLPQVESEETQDVTELSDFGADKMNQLRKTIEERRLQERTKRTVSAPAKAQQDYTARSAAFSMPRKSSLKDLTAGLGDDTGRSDFEEMAKATRTVRVLSPHSTDDAEKQHSIELGDLSTLSNTSRRRRRAASAEGMTSAFIVPDITLHGTTQLPTTTDKACISHIAANCTACHPNKDITIPTPVPVTDRELPQDVDITSATIRPSQAPPIALALVIKQLEDEITHLKLRLAPQQQLYHQHIPALSKRKRVSVKATIDHLQTEIERRSDQVYALHDVLEGQKQAAERGEEAPEEQVEETLMSIGIDPAELAGRVGRTAPPSLGLDGAGDVPSDDEGSVDMPWEGLSDYESEEELLPVGGENRRTVHV